MIKGFKYCLLVIVLFFGFGHTESRAQDIAVPKAQQRRQNLADSLKLSQLSDELDSLQRAMLAHARDSIARMDSLLLDSISRYSASLTVDSVYVQPVKQKFVPDPKKSLWYAIAFPGGGQIYNRKYWKLPLVYGGFLGTYYALSWNNNMYRDYSQAYIDIMDSDPNSKSYMNFIPPSYDVNSNMDRLKDIFKRKKDFYRRYRDLSFFTMIAVYALSVIDAYVDAELSSFDISPDLTMRAKPAVIHDGGNYLTMRVLAGNSYGMSFSIDF